MARNDLLLLTNYNRLVPSTEQCQSEAALSHALVSSVAYIEQKLLNDISRASLFPWVPGMSVLNVRDANTASLYPGTELAQTAADGIITSFPTFPGMSCLANLTASLYLGLAEAHHEVFELVQGQLLCHQREYKGSVSSDPAVRVIHYR